MLIYEEHSKYNQIYIELCDLIGEEHMSLVYESFRGMQVSFPSRLYIKEYIIQQIKERYDGQNGKELAREFGYTAKYFDQLIIEIER